RIAAGVISGWPDAPASRLQGRAEGTLPVISPRTRTARSSWVCAPASAGSIPQHTAMAAIRTAPKPIARPPRPTPVLSICPPRPPLSPLPPPPPRGPRPARAPPASWGPGGGFRPLTPAGRARHWGQFLAKAGPQINPHGEIHRSDLRHSRELQEPAAPDFVSLKSGGIFPTKHRLPSAEAPFEEFLDHVPDSQGDFPGCG